jgi:thioesterase domain-containing protein
VATNFYTILRGGTKSLAMVSKDARLVGLQTAGERTPFFVTSSYPYFIDVVKLIGTDRPVLSLIVPEEMRLLRGYGISLEAAVHVKTIMERQPEGPYMLAGCSRGGLVAYEAAQQLRALGQEVGLLVLFDTPNFYLMPEGTPPLPESTPRRRRRRRLRQLFDTPHWYLLPKAGIRTCLAAVRVALERMRGRDIPCWEAEVASALEYRPAPYLGKLLLVKRHRGLNWQEQYLEPDFGWGEKARGGLEICLVGASDHLQIFKSEVDRLHVAQTLRRCFDEVEARSNKRLCAQPRSRMDSIKASLAALPSAKRNRQEAFGPKNGS